MKARLIGCAVAACFSVLPAAYADETSDAMKGTFAPEVTPLAPDAPVQKAASARVLGARATATGAITVYGGFELATAATVYILVRGNSMGTLGVTQNYLDKPRMRVYNSAGQDLITDQAGRPGFNFCTSTTDQAVISYYAGRNSPVSSNDACVGATFSAGAFTFSVTPTNITGVTSSPASGEILVEVTLGP